MKVVVVGAGPVGMFCGMGLARRGHAVTIVDRDPPPPVAGNWRRSVMQFRHPHFFRPLVCQVLLEYLPEVWQAVVASGGIPAHNDGFLITWTHFWFCRSTFERAMWSVAATEPGLALRTGSAQRVVVDSDRVNGVLVDGALVEADAVIIAASRASHLGDQYRAPVEGGPCGFAYTTHGRRLDRATSSRRRARGRSPQRILGRGGATDSAACSVPNRAASRPSQKLWPVVS